MSAQQTNKKKKKDSFSKMVIKGFFELTDKAKIVIILSMLVLSALLANSQEQIIAISDQGNTNIFFFAVTLICLLVFAKKLCFKICKQLGKYLQKFGNFLFKQLGNLVRFLYLQTRKFILYIQNIIRR